MTSEKWGEFILEKWLVPEGGSQKSKVKNQLVHLSGLELLAWEFIPRRDISQHDMTITKVSAKYHEHQAYCILSWNSNEMADK